ncbi:exodeoxyribonuclease VII large subunit [uncultured Nocardioides sp.]|uniref:exodeoxyribonuclease VII large subunit n=1 Tax=uncultured Nocardioides sp. TaxID=198441 RepID=UPI0026038729|nr:exodeoxyribonuclease VII large subunit [uncultured Nocardioides sp.]
MALETSAEAPAPVRQVAMLVGQWIGKLGAVWVEGQVSQVNRRAGSGTVFLTLRDTLADVSVTVTAPRATLDAMSPPLVEGASVLVHARPSFYAARGSFSLAAREIRAVGLGELLARLERLRQLLAAEGLFAAERKRPLPFLPRRVGLVTARGSAAERDVVENARRRFPGVVVETAYATVQGHRSAAEVIAAVERLDAHPEVDVIVVARGGGNVEDLLPFSDEGLVRAVSRARTPVVSAIGHEQDTPLLDLVADVRASTPTDAARRVVPDLAEEQAGIRATRDVARAVVVRRVEREQAGLDAIRARPSMADPRTMLTARGEEVTALRDRARRTLGHRLDRAADDVDHRRARARALSPLATLRRGYAVVTDADGHVLSAATAGVGDGLVVRVADGRLRATTTAVETEDLTGDVTTEEET